MIYAKWKRLEEDSNPGQAKSITRSFSRLSIISKKLFKPPHISPKTRAEA
jgi:hypothetical protein